MAEPVTNSADEEAKKAYLEMMQSEEAPSDPDEEAKKAYLEMMQSSAEEVSSPTPEPAPTPTPVPTPTPAPTLAPEEIKQRLDSITPDKRYAGVESVIETNKLKPDYISKIDRELKDENERRSGVVGNLNTGVVYGFNPFETIGGIGSTVINALSSASSRPSKVLDEIQASHTGPGDRSLSFERGLGSTVNVMKGLIPWSDQKLGAAIKDWTAFEPEDARTKILRIYTTPIIDENGRVNKESLDYSNLSRDVQNELTVTWAIQRTGLKDPEFWRNVISSRFGANILNSDWQAALKRPLQSADAITFNTISKAYQYLTIGKDIAEARNEKDPSIVPSLAYDWIVNNGGQFDEQGNLQWLPDANFKIIMDQSGKFFGVDHSKVPFPLHNFKPNGTGQEQAASIYSSMIDNTIQTAEYQAFESGAQSIDPTIIWSGGAKLAGKAAMAGLRATRGMEALGALARAAPGITRRLEEGQRVASAISPFAEHAGLGTQAAKAFRPLAPQVIKNVLQVVNAPTKLGTAIRTADRTLSSAALFGALAAVGAPLGAGEDAAATAMTFSSAMLPLHWLGAREAPKDVMLSQKNKDWLREVYAQPDFEKLSAYTKKQVKKTMKSEGITDYAMVREGVLRDDYVDQAVTKAVGEYLSETSTTPALIHQVASNLASDPNFQKYVDGKMPLFTPRGENIYGQHVRAALKKVFDEAEAHASNLKAQYQSGSANKQPGAPSFVPQPYINDHMIKELKTLWKDAPTRLLNDRDMVGKWLDAAIADNPIPELPGISKDTAVALRGQINALPIDQLYVPSAISSIIVSAVKDAKASDLQLVLGEAYIGKSIAEMQDVVKNLPPEEIHSMLKAIENSDEGFSGEGPIRMALRRYAKDKQQDISPSYAAKKLEEDYINAYAQIPKKYKEHAELVKKIESLKDDDPQKPVLQKMADKLLQEMTDLRNNTFLYKIQDFAQNKIQEALPLKKKIHDETLKAAGIDTKEELHNRQRFVGSKLERDLLVERSRAKSIDDMNILTERLDDLQWAKEQAETNAADARSKKDSIVLLRESSKAKKYAQRILIYEDAISSFEQRQKSLAATMEKMDITDVPTENLNDAGVHWYDTVLSMGRMLNIEKTNYYKNLRNAIMDDVNHSRTRYGQLANIMPPESIYKIGTEVKAENIAALRAMATEDFLKSLPDWNMRKIHPGAMRDFKRQVIALADHLALLTEDSRQGGAAITIIDDAMKGGPHEYSELVEAYKLLEEKYFLNSMMIEQKTYALPKIESLLRFRENVNLTHEDFVFLQTLAKDTATGKGYVQRARDTGAIEPWMVTYAQDFNQLTNSILNMDNGLLQKALESTAKLRGLSPDDINTKMAAALFINIGDQEGISRSGMVDLLAMASVLHDAKGGALLPRLHTGEQVALGISRKFGMDVVGNYFRILDAADAAGKMKNAHGRELFDELRKISAGGVTYTQHQRPQSPVRTLMHKSQVAVKGHASIPTVFLNFVESGYHQGLTKIKSSEVKSGANPVEALQRHEIYILTDHLVVDGQLTAVGNLYRKYLGQGKPPDDFLNGVLKQGNHTEAELRQLKTFLGDQFNWYDGARRLSVAEFDVFHQAMGTIQKFDRKGLDTLNALNREMNKRDGTQYGDILYEPWRLDSEVMHSPSLIKDPAQIGTWADADRIMGKRYGTKPENQILKAQTANILTKDITTPPEAIALDRFTKLANEIHSRKARFEIRRIAQSLEYAGFRDMANDLVDEIIQNNTGIKGEDLNFVVRVLEKAEGSKSTGELVSIAFAAARQTGSTYLFLAKPLATMVYQNIETAVTQFSNRPTVPGAYHALMNSAKTFAQAVYEVPSVLRDLVRNSKDIEIERNGQTFKFSGPYAQANAELTGQLTKHSDPWVEARLANLYREGSPFWKRVFEKASDARFSGEAISTRLMFRMKEASENRSVNIMLGQAATVWESALKTFHNDSGAGFYNRIGNVLGGALANDAFQSKLVKMVSEGNELEAYRLFASYYVKANIGTWSHQNVPRFWRGIARFVPGADSFYTAATLGTHRMLMAITNTDGLTPTQKAAAVASVMAGMATSVGLTYMSKNSQIDMFKRFSPNKLVGSAMDTASKGFTTDGISGIFANMGKGPNVTMGFAQSKRLMQIATATKLIAESLAIDAKSDDPNVRTIWKDKTARAALDSFLEQTPAIVFSGNFDATPTDSVETLYYMIHGAVIGGDPYQAQEIQQAVDMSRELADKLRLVNVTGGRRMYTPEEKASLAIFHAWSDFRKTVEESLWQIPPEKRLQVGPEQEMYVRGMLQRDNAAKKFLQITQKVLERAAKEKELSTKTHFNLPDREAKDALDKRTSSEIEAERARQP